MALSFKWELKSKEISRYSITSDFPFIIKSLLIHKSNVAWFFWFNLDLKASFFWKINLSVFWYSYKSRDIFNFALSSCWAAYIICGKVIAVAWVRSLTGIVTYTIFEAIAYTGKACIIVILWCSMAVHQSRCSV